MSRFNTGNPLGSGDPRDLDDNAKNMDLAVNSDGDTFQDRLGKSRLTWAGIVKAGSGDPAIAVDAAARAEAAASSVEQNAEQIAQDAAQQAVDNVVIAVDGAVGRAEGAADRAETAADAAFINADVYPDTAAGRAAVADGEQFQVISTSGLEIVRYEKLGPYEHREVARYPSAQVINTLKTNATFARSNRTPIAIDTTAKTLTISSGLTISSNLEANFEVVPQTIAIPETSGAYLLCYNRPTQTASLKTSKVDEEYVIGYVYVYAGEVSANFDFKYTINGNAPFDNAQFGYLSTNHDSNINFNTVAGTLTIAGNAVRLIVDERTYLMPNSSVTLPSSATDTMYNMSYDVAAGTVHISPSSSPLNKNRVIFGQLLVRAGSYFVFGIPLYQQDGNSSLDKLKNVSTGVMVANSPSAINFNFASKTVEIAANTTRLLFGNNNPLLSTTTVDISANPDVWGQLVYNTASGAFSKKRTTERLTNSEIRVALFHVNNKEVRDVPWYSINGTPASGSDKTDLKTAEFIVPYGDVEPLYDQPELAAYATLATTNGNDFTKIYDMYDALVAEHPDYITKTLLGNDGQGSPIYQYQFNMPEVPLTNEANTKPKILFVSSVHGYEKAGVYNLYFAMKEICERWASDSKLEALKWGVNFLIVPIAVPSGFTLNQRKNHNGVDIARNFTAGWMASDPASDTYSGAAPLDQAESIILDAFMSNNRDAIYFGSHHNFFAHTNGNFIWNASGTGFGVNLCKMLCIRETVKTKQRYSWMPQTNDYYVGYANVGAPIGSEGRQAVEMYGINGGTFEICERFPWEVGNPRYSSAVATIGVESLINWILLNVKHACDLYNSRVNL